MDMSQYQDLFVTESRKHLAAFNELIVRIGENLSDQAVIEEMFRHAHSLKGMAATMQFDAIATLAYRMENLLGRVRSNEIAFCPALADLLLEGRDHLSGMVSVIENGAGEPPDATRLIQPGNIYTRPLMVKAVAIAVCLCHSNCRKNMLQLKRCSLCKK